MKPLSLEICAYGPYKGHEEIDFTRLSAGDGKFLIFGETGSGKTMILDAITCALFGNAKGDARASLPEMRSNKVDNIGEKVNTEVKFRFELKGREYRFERILEMKRKNLTEKCNAYIKDENGIFQPMFENPREADVTAKAEELLGLNREQFRQVIILPQGKFEQFLVSGSDQKQAILTNIFGTDKWQKIAEIYMDKALKRKAHFDDIKSRICNDLENEQARETGDLYNLILSDRDALKEMEYAYEQADYDKEEQEISEKRDILNIWERCEAAENEKKELIRKEKLIDDYRKQVEESTRAETVYPFLKDRNDLEKRIAEEKNKLTEKEKKELPDKTVFFNHAEAEIKNHQERKKEIDDVRSMKIILENKRISYEKITEKQRAWETAVSEFRKAAENELSAKTEYETAEADMKTVSDCWMEQQRKTTEYTGRYIAGIGGELAKTLQEGKPCPVCGSVHHPDKARISNDAISKEVLDEQRRQENLAGDRFNAADKVYKAKKDEYETKKNAASAADMKAKLAGQALKTAEKDLIAGISDIAELKNRISEADLCIRQYENREKELYEEKDRAVKELTAVRTSIRDINKTICELEEQRNNSDEKLKAALAEQGLTHERQVAEMLLQPRQKNELQKEISEYCANLKKCTDTINELAPKLTGERPDRLALAERIAEIRRIR
ncbi:MAG: SMC family ATPase, partial [Parasporobacterium sp.]|nr:SMC family ATPase [Parasporobacterium sp.]